MKLTKKSLAIFAFAALLAGALGLHGASAATTWDISGTHDFVMSYNGSDYTHSVTLTQDGDGNLDGTGSSGAYAWDITSGSIADGDITFDANYTATADAVTPQTVLHVEASINEDGSLSGTWSDNYQGGERSGAVSSDAGFASASASVTTNAATAITSSNATLNGMNVGSAAIGHSFWASLSPFSTDSPVLPSGVYSTPDMGALNADTAFSASLSSVSGLPAITADTTYYFAAWVNIDGTWYPGDVLSLETSPVDQDSDMVTVSIRKYVDGAYATATSADNSDFTMNASWDAENIGAGSGQYALSENGFGGDPTPYQAVTVDMTSGADYSTSEVMDSVTAASCDTDAPYALLGYSYGDSWAAAQAATKSLTPPALTNITSDKYVIVWNDDCSTEGNGDIGGEVVGGNGVLAVTSIETLDSSAVADGTFENGWEYAFNITVPSNEPNLAMKFANWLMTGGSSTIPAANNFRISSAQADNGGATVPITAADTYSTPALHMTGDLNPSLDGMQVRVIVEARVPTGTPNGSYTTSYGVLTN